MTEMVKTRPVDKSTWGNGPWNSEPDRVEWEHAGLPCLALRGPMGNWCGYAAVSPGHPSHGASYDDVDVRVHGGLTYSAKCSGHICHVPKPGEPDDVFWVGFDCGHAGDFSPGLNAKLRSVSYGSEFGRQVYDHAAAVKANDWTFEVYRTLDYVQAETNQLAEQLVALAQPTP